MVCFKILRVSFPESVESELNIIQKPVFFFAVKAIYFVILCVGFVAILFGSRLKWFKKGSAEWKSTNPLTWDSVSLESDG